jgi:arylsulfatase A-like enzyme
MTSLAPTQAEVDSAIGKILGSLDAAGLGEDTLVFLTADNGAVREFYQNIALEECHWFHAFAPLEKLPCQ